MASIMEREGTILERIRDMESYYIFKPMKDIRDVFYRMFFVDFLICTMLSFHIFWVPMIPAWLYCIFRQYIRVRYLEKYNFSAGKVLILMLFVLSGEFVAAHYVRQLVWYILTNIRF